MMLLFLPCEVTLMKQIKCPMNIFLWKKVDKEQKAM